MKEQTSVEFNLIHLLIYSLGKFLLFYFWAKSCPEALNIFTYIQTIFTFLETENEQTLSQVQAGLWSWVEVRAESRQEVSLAPS